MGRIILVNPQTWKRGGIFTVNGEKLNHCNFYNLCNNKIDPHPKNKIDNSITDMGVKQPCLKMNIPSTNDIFGTIGIFVIQDYDIDLNSIVKWDFEILKTHMEKKRRTNLKILNQTFSYHSLSFQKIAAKSNWMQSRWSLNAMV